MSLRLRLGVGGVVGELDAAGLAAPAGQHLRLDDDRAAELLGRLARLLGRRREAPVRDGDPDAAEELLALVLVEIHRRRTLATPCVTAQFAAAIKEMSGTAIHGLVIVVLRSVGVCLVAVDIEATGEDEFCASNGEQAIWFNAIARPAQVERGLEKRQPRGPERQTAEHIGKPVRAKVKAREMRSET